ncbi:MAG: hypothetical protein COV44_00080 [Deltaproteobacteria bacterium CG11_big_fil_rev_8_21_14_0_20_45_16]|nr:MAG: hypothetical protein COV44_00080 [Deltaproteobacteria bacterium CG11_big_fil_rev_8_21_14_0_20_45_16]
MYRRFRPWFLFIFVNILGLQAQGLEENIRFRGRAPGLYLSEAESLANPETSDFTTTREPLAPLSVEGIRQFFESKPDLSGKQIVLIGAPILGDLARDYQALAEDQISLFYRKEVAVTSIRHPSGLLEKSLNMLPRREDLAKPIPYELLMVAPKLVLDESLAWTLMLGPPIVTALSVSLPEGMAGLAGKVGMPLSVAVPMVVLDVAHVLPLILYRRFLSNHNLRLNTWERFGRQFALSLIFSIDFYLVSQWPQILEALKDPSLSASLSGLAKMISIAVPASIFNMLARTTVHSSINQFEQSGPARRRLATNLELLAGMLIAPTYIFSTLPLLKPVISLPLMDLNMAHLGLLALGGAGGVAWMGLERKNLSVWLKNLGTQCKAGFRALAGRTRI